MLSCGYCSVYWPFCCVRERAVCVQRYFTSRRGLGRLYEGVGVRLGERCKRRHGEGKKAPA